MGKTRNISSSSVTRGIFLLLLVFVLTGCGGKGKNRLSEYQEWVDFNNNVRDMITVYTEAFFREYQRLPSSLEELQSSDWYWFAPIPPKFAENYELVDRELGSYDDDADKIQISFTETGITYVFYYRASEETGQAHLYKGLTLNDVKSGYERNIANDIETGFFNVSQLGYIRQNLVYAISRLLIRRYVEANQRPPSRPEKLYEGRWDPDEEIFNELDVIPSETIHACYAGTAIVDGEAVLYMELMQPNGEPFIEQRVYNIDNQMNSVIVAETILEESKQVRKEETQPLFDSSVLGWGII